MNSFDMPFGQQAVLHALKDYQPKEPCEKCGRAEISMACMPGSFFMVMRCKCQSNPVDPNPPKPERPKLRLVA